VQYQREKKRCNTHLILIRLLNNVIISKSKVLLYQADIVVGDRR
jgi:hypothetical protein